MRRLADAVRRLGYSVWWDEELPAHVAYSDVIADKIGAAQAAIVVWSQTAAASQWVRAEADLARNQKKLIQASVDARLPPMPFNQIQCAAIGDWRGEDDHLGWQKIRASLDALVGPREPVAAAPPPPPVAAVPHRWHKLLIGAIAAAFLLIAGAALFAWLRPAPPPAGDAQLQAGPGQAGKPAHAADAPWDGEMRRHCPGAGGDQRVCAKWRARYGRPG